MHDIAEGSDLMIFLQSLINITSGFCLRKKMEVHLSNKKNRVFRNGGFLKNYEKWYLRGQSIEVVSAYKYMGSTIKVRKAANIRNRYNQVPHLTQDTRWESDKNTIKHHKQEQRGQPLPSR